MLKITTNRFADKLTIQPARLNNWDYSTWGFYFITICTLNGNKFFGKIINNKMTLSKAGIIANQCLINIPKHFPCIKIIESIVMPNHAHLLLHLADSLNPDYKTTIRNFPVETPDLASLHDNRPITLIKYSHKNHPDYFSRLSQKSKQLIPKIIQQYKSSVTRQINPKTRFFSWQPRFYDHLIRNQKELFAVKNYILSNPINWPKDKYYAN